MWDKKVSVLVTVDDISSPEAKYQHDWPLEPLSWMASYHCHTGSTLTSTAHSDLLQLPAPALLRPLQLCSLSQIILVVDSKHWFPASICIKFNTLMLACKTKYGPLSTCNHSSNPWCHVPIWLSSCNHHLKHKGRQIHLKTRLCAGTQVMEWTYSGSESLAVFKPRPNTQTFH